MKIIKRNILLLALIFPNIPIAGVDFGLAFGAGTRDLIIPELIPCRFTPQFMNALSPLYATGYVKKTMIHAMRVFRAERKVLKAVMEVFVKEPTMDWLQSAQQLNLFNDQPLSLDSQWEPLKRIDIVERKLIGGNPMLLTREELEEGIIGQ